MLPGFLGVGAQRAGTTWIARNLAEHPDIYIPWEKELHFFDRHYENGIEYYERQFADWSGQHAVGEVTPAYLHEASAARRIHRHLPAAKLIVCLRNPVDRIYSSYWYSSARSANGSPLPFEDWLRQHPDAIDVGCYYDHLKRYLELFSREQLLVLLFEDLGQKPEAFLRAVFLHLGVDPDFQSPIIQQQINAAAAHKNLARLKPIWYLRRALGRAGMHRLAGRLERMNMRTLPPMRGETREWLVEEYREENELLEQLLQWDLSAWSTLSSDSDG